jgi:hypothetical protein
MPSSPVPTNNFMCGGKTRRTQQRKNLSPCLSESRTLIARVRGLLVDAADPAHAVRAPSPQTKGKIERFRETLKARLNRLVYTGEWRRALGVYRVLQPPALPREPRRRDTRRCLLRAAGRNLQTKGGAKTADLAGTISVQSRPENQSSNW